ncbi:MAG: thioredoxin [Deltaproteobacteria bacterium]|nr:thioredoxin [Deltaproteobacteria bacterium]
MSSQYITDVTDSTFEKEVLKSDKPTVVDFWAEWCGPCKAVSPKLDELAKKYNGKVRVVKMNVDLSTETPARFGIRGIPTLILFKNGENVDQVVGNQPLERMEALFQSGLE